MRSTLTTGQNFRDHLSVTVDRSYAEIATLSAGTSEQFLLSSGEQTLILENIDRLVLEDGYLAFDFDGKGGAAFRIYQAAFDRMPDASGLGFWIDVLDEGNLNLIDVSELFLSSPEFVEMNGDVLDMSNDEYLDLLYGNILDREPDEEGFTFWREVLELGLSRAETLAHFSESKENRAELVGVMSEGIWYLCY